jgi:nucleoside-diphosphate-sugar epimerase
MSTCSVYGKNEESMLSETSSTNPLSSYARTKLEAEGHLAYSNAIIFRLGTIFGLGDAFARPRFDLVVNVMTADMVKNGKLTVYGGLQSRPLVHAKDIARFIYEAMYRNIVGIFNITNYNMTIGELAGIIQNIVGGDIRVIPEDQSDERDYTVSTDKLTNIFKTSFAYALEPAIGEIARVIERGRIKDHKDPVFNNKLNLEGQL